MAAVPRIGVGVVVRDEGRLLLIQRGTSPALGKWAVPGGHVEKGESLRAAAVREVAEETGLDVSIGPIAWEGKLPRTDGSSRLVIVDFHATSFAGSLRAGSDAVSAEWVALADAGSRDLVPSMYSLLEALA